MNPDDVALPERLLAALSALLTAREGETRTLALIRPGDALSVGDVLLALGEDRIVDGPYERDLSNGLREIYATVRPR